MAVETPVPRQRERNPVVVKMIERFEALLRSANATAEELRDVRKRLRRYEAEPPVFPLALMDQMKKLRRFGVTVEELASLYRVSTERVERVLNDDEVPLLASMSLPAKTRQRAIHV